MFDDLKEKIEDFISSVRSKLPGSKSKDDDEEYEEEGEFDEKTEEINVKEKISDSEDDEASDDEDDEEEEEDDESAAKAKKQKFIRLGLVGVVLILGASILMDEGGDEDNVLPAPNPIVKKNRPKRKKKVDTAEKKEEQVKEVAKEEQVKEVAKEEQVKEVAKEEPATEVVKIPEEEKSAPVVDEAQGEETIVVENELKLNDDSDDEAASRVEELGKEGFGEESSGLGEESANLANQGNVNDNTDMSEAIDDLTNSEQPAMIEKVVKAKLEYQEPPNYQNTGRGLVYNCTGKHWACVDQTSYLNCKKNHDWSKENEKSPECYNSNVYSSFKDCRTIQVYNINTITETDFCN